MRLGVVVIAAGCGTGHDAGTLGMPVAGELVASVSNPLTALPSAPVRGTPNDSWADVVLGKPDFTQIQQYRVVQNLLYIPEGVWIDRSRHSSGTQKMYAYDSGNNRILGYNWDSCVASATIPLGCTPTIVLGQPNFTSSGCNGDSGFQAWPSRTPASRASLCTLQESQLSVPEGGSGASMVTDASGTLYVADFFNNRVLKYIDPFATDALADAVWGQANFVGNACNKGNAAPDATTLCFNWGNNNSWTAGVDLDLSGHLWIADSGNHRILHFPPGSTTADIVIGQNTFATNGEGTALNQLEDPVAIRFSQKTGNLYVADNGADNHRVVRFAPPFTTGMSGTLFQTLPSPMGIDVDPAGQGLWITDRGTGTIQLWTEAQVPTETRSVTSPGDLRLSGSIGIDLADNMASASRYSTFGQSITVFKTNGQVVPITPNNGQNGGYGGNLLDNASIGNLRGLEATGNQLIVADLQRLMVWNSPATLASGAAATIVNATPVCCVNSLKADAKGQNLWTAYGNGLYDAGPFTLVAYPLPMGGPLTPAKTIDLSVPIALAGGGTIDLSGDHVMSIAPDTSGALWITGGGPASRVVRIRGALTGTPTVDVVLGQADPNSKLCNRHYQLGFDDISDRFNAQPNTLCAPGSVSIDTMGNVWVSDHSIEINGNLRLLEFEASMFPPVPSTPIYGPAATRIYTQAATFESAFDSTGRLVEGFNAFSPDAPLYKGSSYFRALYWHPLSATPQQPDVYLSDYESFPYSAAFDSQGNFYAGDKDRSRVLVYHGVPSPGGSDAGADAASDAAAGDAAADATASNSCASGATVMSVSSCSSLPSFNTAGSVCVKVKVNTVNGWNASNVQGRTATAQGATIQGPITPINGSIPNQPGLPAGSDGFVYFNFTAGQISYSSMACW